MSRPLNIVVLGRGKTGSLVADIANERRHQVHVVSRAENMDAAWLTPEHLARTDVVVDFTTPDSVIANVAAVVRAGKAMVVGTTGWHAELDRVRALVEAAGTGFVFGANFSYGVNLFLEILRAASPALTHGYHGHIAERHHVHKRDAPSGTALLMQQLMLESSGTQVSISSERQGDVAGTHILELLSSGDRIVLMHEAKSRRTFAEGAVLAAEWLAGKQGFYDFQDIFRQL